MLVYFYPKKLCTNSNFGENILFFTHPEKAFGDGKSFYTVKRLPVRQQHLSQFIHELVEPRICLVRGLGQVFMERFYDTASLVEPAPPFCELALLAHCTEQETEARDG